MGKNDVCTRYTKGVNLSKKHKPQQFTDIQQELVNAYLKYVRKHKRHPTRAEMLQMGYTRDRIRRHFNSLNNLREQVRNLCPEIFHGIIDKEYFTQQKLKELEGKIAKYKKFIVTTAVNGCKVNVKFLKSLETYCKVNKAALLILPSNDPAHNLDNEHRWNFDSVLADKLLVFDDIRLNHNLYLSAIKISAKQIDPITGLARIGQKKGSFIYASPKQRMKMVPVSNNKIPHAVMTTGAITEPNYKTNRYMSARTAYISTADHVMGAIVVEIENKEFFHYRQIQANEDGSFIDLNKKYNGNKVANCYPSAFVLGDWHSGDTDPNAKNVWIDIIKTLKPKILVLHDVFNGKSINHHDDKNYVYQSQKALVGQTSLHMELLKTASDIDELSKLAEIVIVKSNHDEFLTRYLSEFKFKYDSLNQIVAMELASQMARSADPLRYGVENLGGLKNKGKVVWLKRDEEFKVSGVELGVHGDRGANGARGNLNNMELSYGSCVVGHTHSPEILRSAFCVGTSTFLSLDYNKGPSSWCHTSCLVHGDGSKQLINCINNNWRGK